MKIILPVFFLFLFADLTNAQEVSFQAKESFNKVKWIEGMWIRTNSKQGRTGHERWQKFSLTELRGFGVTMNGVDTAFVEKISIVIKDNILFYVADVVENKRSIYFKFTELSDNGFECENPDHDFPKKITYQCEGNKLKVVVSGDGKSIDYLFERK